MMKHKALFLSDILDEWSWKVDDAVTVLMEEVANTIIRMIKEEQEKAENDNRCAVKVCKDIVERIENEIVG